MAALSYFPGSVRKVLDAVEESMADEEINRLGDVFNGFIDASDDDPVPATPISAEDKAEKEKEKEKEKEEKRNEKERSRRKSKMSRRDRCRTGN